MRYYELDLLRTLAILMMVLYHTTFVLWFYYGWDFSVLEGGWWLLARTTSTLFLLIVGISAVLASRGKDRLTIWKRSFKRGMIVFVCSMIITAVTFIIEPAYYIQFGILHCIGISMMLLPLFLPLREWNLIPALFIMIIGFSLKGLASTTSLLLPFGIVPYGYQTIDYFPLFPNLGMILLGVALGSFLFDYLQYQPQLRHPIWQKLSIPGRYSLLIYMLHVPVIVAIAALAL